MLWKHKPTNHTQTYSETQVDMLPRARAHNTHTTEQTLDPKKRVKKTKCLTENKRTGTFGPDIAAGKTSLI